MNPPIAELIYQNFLQALARVNRANGYSFDLVAERIKQQENHKRHLLALLVDTDPPRKEGQQSQGRTMVNQTIAIEVYYFPDSKDPIPLGQVITLIISDVSRAILEDPTRGGYAIDTATEDPELIFNDELKTQGVSVNFNVKFRFKTADPTQL